MRILYFIPHYEHAAMGNRIHFELLMEWRQLGVEAEVLSLSAGVTRPTRSVEDGVVIHRLPASGRLPLKVANRALGLLVPYPFFAGAALGLRHFLASHRDFDLLHCDTAFPLGLAATIAGPYAPPLVLKLPGADVMAEPAYDYGYGRFRSVRAALPHVFRRARVIRAESPMVQTIAIDRGAPAQRVAVVPCNITDDSYLPAGDGLAEQRARARAVVVARHGLDPARPIVLSLNRLHPFKGIEYLVESVPHARAAGVAPQVLIVGPNRRTPRFGDYGAYLAQRAVELGVAADVHLLGGMPPAETLIYKAAADLVVVPSVAEGFSRVVFEACAVGTPPIVTSTTGASAFVAEADAGLIVPPCSGRAIGVAIAEAIADPAAWAGYSRRSIGLAPRCRSARIAADLAGLYQAALAN